MSKRTPAAAWKALEEMALDDEMHRVAAMSADEREAELRDAGIDLDALGASIDRTLGTASSSAPVTPVTPLRPRARRAVLSAWLIAAVLAALAATTTVATLLARRSAEPSDQLETAPPPGPAPSR
jgi:hypothetical protein